MFSLINHDIAYISLGINLQILRGKVSSGPGPDDNLDVVLYHDCYFILMIYS